MRLQGYMTRTTQENREREILEQIPLYMLGLLHAQRGPLPLSTFVLLCKHNMACVNFLTQDLHNLVLNLFDDLVNLVYILGIKEFITITLRNNEEPCIALSQHGFDFLAAIENKGDIKRNIVKDAQELLPQAQCRVFITFSSACTFTTEEASAYFSAYGEVKHVRIPVQEHRTFGFVTFATPHAVTKILSRTNPVHYISNDRVVVKEYKKNANPNKLHGRIHEERPSSLPAAMGGPPIDITAPTPADLVALAITKEAQALYSERECILGSYFQDVEEPQWQHRHACLDNESKKAALSHPSSASSPCFSSDELEDAISSSLSIASSHVLSQPKNLWHIHERDEEARKHKEFIRRRYRIELLRKHLWSRAPTARVESTLTYRPDPSRNLGNLQWCSKCKSSTQDVVGTSCGHGFCLKCLTKVLWIPQASCPLCFLSL